MALMCKCKCGKSWKYKGNKPAGLYTQCERCKYSACKILEVTE